MRERRRRGRMRERECGGAEWGRKERERGRETGRDRERQGEGGEVKRRGYERGGKGETPRGDGRWEMRDWRWERNGCGGREGMGK